MGVAAIKETIRKARTSFLSKAEVREYYAFKEKIGAGYFATVYRAVERKTGGEVAIKCINKSKVMGKENMLNEEVSILQKVEHPNCVSMIEIFESPKHVYLVMELVTGGELFQRIIQKKVFTEEDAVRIITDLCEGLKYLHNLGIVHRDLKPENILLEDESDKARLKITDFGLSKVMTDKNSFLHSRCGTPAYAAPELIDGQPYGAKVDMWAVGCILYILLSGRPPFWGDTNNELFGRILNGVYPMNTPQWDPIGRRAKDLVKGLLCLDADARLSAEDVLKHSWITETATRGQKPRAMSSLTGLKAILQNRPKQVRPKSKAPDRDDEYARSMENLPVEEVGYEVDLGRSTEDALEEELTDEALMLAPVGAETILRMERKYSSWGSFRIEFEAGNLLGCTTWERIVEILARPSTWKVRAMELGYIRPFLFLCSMHPRQRVSYGKLIGLDVSTHLWFGDPHREAWEIISNRLDGLKAKTRGGSGTWWSTLVQVSDATLRHFWGKGIKKSMKRPKMNKSQATKACMDPTDAIVPGYEEVFLDASLKRLMQLQSKKSPADVLPIKFAHTADLNTADGEEADLISNLLAEFRLKPIVLKFINWYVAEGFKRSQDNAIFMGWVEKERTLSLSSVFLGKGHARVLFPIVFAMLTQRLFLSTYDISINNFYPSPGDE